MNAQEALATFQSLTRQSGKVLDRMLPSEAVATMVQFYIAVRAADCDLAKDDDMLLFQWGLHDWGQGEAFVYSIARQFIVRAVNDNSESDRDVQAIWQLSLILKFAPTPELRAVQPGHKWCESPNGTTDFANYIEACEATHQVASRNAESVELIFQNVE